MKKIFWRSLFCPRQRTQLLYDIGVQIGAELDLERLLFLIVERVKNALGFSYCAILLREGNDLVIRAVTEYPETIIGKKIPLGKGVSGRCALESKEMLIGDLAKCDFYLHLGDSVFNSELDIPIIFHETLLGVFNVQSTRKNGFRDRDIEFLRILSHQIAIALHNSQMLAQMELLHEIGINLASISKSKELFESIVTQVCQRLHFYSCAILEMNNGQLVFKASSGEFSGEMAGFDVPMGRSAAGRCVQEMKLINVGNICLESGYISLGTGGIRSEIACPVISDGKLLGVLMVESRKVNAFGENDIRLLTILSLQIAVAMSNVRMYAEIEKLAITDPMTGLYNFRYFHQRLGSEIARSQRYRHPLSIMMIDLDDFKKINDRYGHLSGDRVLREAAKAFRENIRRYDEPTVLKGNEIDIISRYGGEEFIIIQPDTPLEGALVCAERLREILQTTVGRKAGLPFTKNSAQQITGSFGVTAFEVGESMDSMIKRVDTAMYQAKAQGKNRVLGL